MYIDYTTELYRRESTMVKHTSHLGTVLKHKDSFVLAQTTKPTNEPSSLYVASGTLLQINIWGVMPRPPNKCERWRRENRRQVGLELDMGGVPPGCIVWAPPEGVRQILAYFEGHRTFLFAPICRCFECFCHIWGARPRSGGNCPLPQHRTTPASPILLIWLLSTQRLYVRNSDAEN